MKKLPPNKTSAKPKTRKSLFSVSYNEEPIIRKGLAARAKLSLVKEPVVRNFTLIQGGKA